jgi:xanthine dehydrogenase accessory factor
MIQEERGGCWLATLRAPVSPWELQARQAGAARNGLSEDCHDMRQLVKELLQVLEQEQECVYCAVVETRGSTPQKPGAAMLVFPDGSQSGTLGGGCVEAEVKLRALRVLAGAEGQPQLLTFHLDNDYGWDDGLICGGRMTILADPLPRQAARRQLVRDYCRTWQELVEQGEGGTEAVVLAAVQAGVPEGSRYLFGPAGELRAALGPLPLPEMLPQALRPVQERPRPYQVRGVAYLPFLPRITVLIVGGGHVGQAVARLAAEADFDIWVVDDRSEYASADRFPMARRLLVGPIGPTLARLAAEEITPRTYCLIVTRGHHHDEEALYHLAESRAGYVGMIGSKRKIRLIFEDLEARGVSRTALARVHAPVGLAIGSQTVPEIAVSIVAELIACRNLGKAPAALRESVWP